jgi:hypothetical protein
MITLQAGRQLAWLTGGDIREGMHEVVCTPATRAALAATAGRRPLWRVSSTVFTHARRDAILEPIVPRGCASSGAAAEAEFPPVTAEEQVAAEVSAINLAAEASMRDGRVALQ